VIKLINSILEISFIGFKCLENSPYEILLYNNIVKHALKTIPVPPKIAIIGLIDQIPNRLICSATKLRVNGVAILAKQNTKNKIVNKGIYNTNPLRYLINLVFVLS
jgi:hypothetical protein